MIDKDKIKAEIERQIKGLEVAKEMGIISDYGRGGMEHLKYILSFVESLQEELVSIWHDTSEEPNINSMIIYKCNGCVPDVGRFLGSADVEGHFSWEIFKYPRSIIINNIEKWAHIDDILKL